MSFKMLVSESEDAAVWSWLQNLKNYKATEPGARAAVSEVIDILEATLDLKPAVKMEELTSASAALDLIQSPEDRVRASELRRELVEALKQTDACTEDSVARIFARHRAKKAWQKSLRIPLENALDRVDAVIEADLAAQAEKLRAEQEAARKAQEEARRAADLEAQKARQQAAFETARRLAAEEAARTARSAAARLRADQEIAAAKAAEREAKDKQEAARQLAAQAAIVPEFVPSAPVAVASGVSVVKGKWKARVYDIEKVPAVYLMPRVVNQKMLDAACEATKAETRIAGVEAYQEADTVRSKRI